MSYSIFLSGNMSAHFFRKVCKAQFIWQLQFLPRSYILFVFFCILHQVLRINYTKNFLWSLLFRNSLKRSSMILSYVCTLQRQFRLNIPFLGKARPQVQFPHSCVFERFILYCIFPGSVYAYFLQQNRQTHRGNIPFIRSQTHECGNWDWGPDILFLRIFVSNFRHFVFAV